MCARTRAHITVSHSIPSRIPAGALSGCRRPSADVGGRRHDDADNHSEKAQRAAKNLRNGTVSTQPLCPRKRLRAGANQ